MYFMWASIGTSNGEGLNRHPAEDYLTWSMPPDASAAVEAVYRSDWGRIVATLIRLVRDFDVAEEAAQEAFAAAVGQWRASGVPEFPRAWIIQTARHKAIDRLRRQTRFAEKLDAYTAAGASLTVETPEFDPGDIPDDRLRLIFTCCHPALALEAQVALTLRTLGGLETDEIARAFLVPTATMAQRLVRAKGKIRDAGIPYTVPDTKDMPARLDAVLTVIYLVFNEGYLPTRGAALVRRDLCVEAIRLARLVRALTAPPRSPWWTALDRRSPSSMRWPLPATSTAITCCMPRGLICCAAWDPRRKRRRAMRERSRWSRTTPSADFSRGGYAKFSRGTGPRSLDSSGSSFTGFRGFSRRACGDFPDCSPTSQIPMCT